jgi:hypothetical protein
MSKVVNLLAASLGLRGQMGLAEKLPHYTALQKFSARNQGMAIAQSLLVELVREFPGRAGRRRRRWMPPGESDDRQ